ncbi:MAG TPA: DUF2066 domain-containing protein [Pseudomonadales bacterium]
MRKLLILLLVVLPAGALRAAEVVPWLYEVAVAVASQSDGERRRASSEGLSVLLTRLTGLAEVPRTPEVSRALAGPESYYNEFHFAVDDAGALGGERALELVVQFDPDPVLDLIRRADLPIWRASRERVLVWAVVQEGAERTIIGSTSALPLVQGLIEQARVRGVPLNLPLLDLEDQLAVDPAAVWGRLSQVIDPASQRYGADIVLIGRITPDAFGGWQSDWEFWLDGTLIPFAAEGADLTEQGRAVVNVLTDELAARRVVHNREAGRLAVSVSGIASPADYGALLGYLRSLEFVQGVGVSGIRDGRLWIVVDTPAEAPRLLETFQRDGQLFEDQLALIDGADLRLVWRGGG